MPVGIHEDKTKSFNKLVIDVEENDMLYIFSDGYQDQFGGPRNKKFKIKNLKNLFAEIYKEPVNKQKEILSDKFYNWIEESNSYQIDDVIVIGVKIKP